ncbi:hypothetical protein ACTQ1O_13635 [Bilifractor sp. LCP21S3_A7]|uniref:hypothetical protein n=1 Tax=Bilifractor sp. LCP21S3_A7 TaxID=3438738 RepID=UPI003F933B44
MKKRESFLFLIELMISILIFFVVAAICLLIFSKAHRMNCSSQELNLASRAEANLAELISSAGSMEEAEKLIREAFPEAEFSDQTGKEQAGEDQIGEDRAEGPDVSLVIPYDSQLKQTEKRASYQLTAVIHTENGMVHADMHFYPVDRKGQNTGDSVYDLAIRSVIPDTWEGETS